MGAGASPPLSVEGLGCLQRACFVSLNHELVQGAHLGAGPWVRSLQRLCCHYSVLLNSPMLLESGVQLQQLGLIAEEGAAAQDDDSGRFWQWCASHAPLKHLVIDLPVGDEPTGDIPSSLMVALDQLRNAHVASAAGARHVQYTLEEFFAVRRWRHQA